MLRSLQLPYAARDVSSSAQCRIAAIERFETLTSMDIAQLRNKAVGMLVVYIFSSSA